LEFQFRTFSKSIFDFEICLGIGVCVLVIPSLRDGMGLSSFDSVLFQNRQADAGSHRKKSPHMISANITQKVKAAFASAFAPSFASVLA
jgi:hypothetical protein